MKRICVIGNFSGRNAGDAAILEGLLHDVYSLHQDLEFLIPTINRRFVEETYRRFPIQPIPLMPWNFSVKIFGLPIVKAVLQSDLVVVTDAILFDRKLWNPLYNYLSTMALVLPMAKRRGIPVVLYNVNLGPVASSLGRLCLKRVLESSELVIVRDRESHHLLAGLNLGREDIRFGADCALNIPAPSGERLDQIKEAESILEEKERYLSFNVSSYLHAFVEGIEADRFIPIIAETMDQIMGDMGKKIILVITQPMDLGIANRVLDRVSHRDRICLISNRNYSHNEIAGILSQVEMHVGMRLHTLILATSFCTPTVGIMATPKNRAYMKSIEQEDRTIEFGETFTTENLLGLIEKTWIERKMIREELEPIIAREKEKARKSAKYLESYLR